VEYGWRIKMVGEKCFVTHVRPGSDADKKGVKVGDQVLMLENFRVSRADLWKMSYFYNVISKRSSMKMTLLSPGGTEPRVVVAMSEIKRQPQNIAANTYFRLFDDFYDERNSENRYVTQGPATVWNFPSFGVDPQFIETLVDKPKKSQSMIIDLRGNGCGYVTSLEKLVGHLFDKDISIAELKGIKKMDPMRSKTQGGGAYKGKVIVLIDSESASAAEILARVVQLEKRGVVLGDVSSGKVMQSKTDIIEAGGNTVYVYGVSVTNADVLMADGKSLEHVGVTPDELILPTAEDIAAGRDPVLARAFEIAGSKVDPIVAGKYFPYYWAK
jgi:carboxyl-terminal processing protease